MSPSKRQSRSDSRASGLADKALQAPPKVSLGDIFAPGMLRVPVFRIPALLTLPDGIALAFSEARPGLHDSGVINLVMRRSTDNGKTWSSASVVVEGDMVGQRGTSTVGNPTAVYDASTKKIWLMLCTNHSRDVEWQIHADCGIDSRRVWICQSADLGTTWSAPHEITSSVKLRGWTWYATGPGVGIQLASGRLVMPANHAENVHERDHPYLVDRKRSRMVAHIIYSDDHGESWQLGGCAAKHTNETTVGVFPDGQLILNSRDWTGRFLRQIQYSNDEGKTWGSPRHDPLLVEPEPQGCQGSLLVIPHKERPKGTTFFCNPSSDRREMLTVRRSDDGGHSWCASFCLEPGASAYSSLGLLADGALGVLFERGDRISFARIPSHPNGPLGSF